MAMADDKAGNVVQSTIIRVDHLCWARPPSSALHLFPTDIEG